MFMTSIKSKQTKLWPMLCHTLKYMFVTNAGGLESFYVTCCVIHSNICSLQANADGLESFLCDLEFKFDVVSLKHGIQKIKNKILYLLR